MTFNPKIPNLITSKKNLVHICLLILLNSLVCTLIIQLGNNTLYKGNFWEAGKRNAKMGITGSDEFLTSRAPLYKQRLDLGRWYGHQQVTTELGSTIKKGSVAFKIENGQYLSLSFGNNPYLSPGIILSRNIKRPSSTYLIDDRKSFASKKIINDLSLSEGWHKLEFFIEENILKFLIDGQSLIQMILEMPYKLDSLEMSAGLTGALVDDVHLSTEKGRIFEDDFFYTKRSPVIFLFISLLFFIGIYFALYFKKPGDLKNIFLFSYSLLASQVSFLAFDTLWYSNLELSPFSRSMEKGKLTSPINTIEKFRYGFFHLAGLYSPSTFPSGKVIEERGYPGARIYKGPIVCQGNEKCQKRALETIPSKLGKNVSKMVLVGTSQSIGSGASSLERSFFEVLHNRLQAELSGEELLSLNLSESGSNPKMLFTKYSSRLDQIKANILVLNLVNNGNDSSYYEGITKLIEQGKRNKSEIFLVQEAISPESLVDYSERRKFLNEYEKNGVFIIDLDSHLKLGEVYEKGFLFWDFIHFKDHGHQVSGNYLADKIIQQMASR